MRRVSHFPLTAHNVQDIQHRDAEEGERECEKSFIGAINASEVENARVRLFKRRHVERTHDEDNNHNATRVMACTAQT